jgi:sec-independent protein translocase protein TatA
MILFVMLGAIGATEILLILLGLLVLFGGKKIPELMKGLGEGIREFKKASKVPDDEPKKDIEVEEKK